MYLLEKECGPLEHWRVWKFYVLTYTSYFKLLDRHKESDMSLKKKRADIVDCLLLLLVVTDSILNCKKNCKITFKTNQFVSHLFDCYYNLSCTNYPISRKQNDNFWEVIK